MAAAFAAAVSVNVLEAPVATVVGLKAAVTPVGKPTADNVTLPALPLTRVTEIVVVFPGSVGVIVRLLGLAVSENGTVTVSETVVCTVNAPEVPVTVMV